MPGVEGYTRELLDGRLEAMVKAPGCRLRVSGTAEQVWEAVELFEKWTGLSVEAERRPRRIAKPIKGQLVMTELQSEGSHGSE